MHKEGLQSRHQKEFAKDKQDLFKYLKLSVKKQNTATGFVSNNRSKNQRQNALHKKSIGFP